MLVFAAVAVVVLTVVTPSAAEAGIALNSGIVVIAVL